VDVVFHNVFMYLHNTSFKIRIFLQATFRKIIEEKLFFSLPLQHSRCLNNWKEYSPDTKEKRSFTGMPE
jgi:hypothetical protein